MTRQAFAGHTGVFRALALMLTGCALTIAPMTAAHAREKSSHHTSSHRHLSWRTRDALHLAHEMHADDRYLWCVPFARVASGVDIHGNARTWWSKARNRYDRAHTPRVGAVMTFRPSRRIPLGHVAVVAKVVSSREILVNQANWHRNKVSLGMAVEDVSPHNDWSEVRVASYDGRFGSVYPVLGFISPRGERVEPHPIGLAPLRPVRPELRPAEYFEIVPASAPAHSLAPSVALVPRLRPGTAAPRIVAPRLEPPRLEASVAVVRTVAHSFAPRVALVPRLRPSRPAAPMIVASTGMRPELRPADIHG